MVAAALLLAVTMAWAPSPAPVVGQPKSSPGASKDPAATWTARDRRLVTHTAVSGAFVAAPLLTISGITIAMVGRAEEGERTDSLAYTQFFALTMGIPVAAASGIALVVWATRLARHRRSAPPGITWPGSRVRLQPTPMALRLSF